MSRRGYMLRSGRDDWRTPDDILALVREVLGGQPHLDPCAPRDSAIAPIAAVNFRGPLANDVDGLAAEWKWSAFVNPPFGQLARWAEKAANAASAGVEILFLLPARTDTRYWHEHIATANAIAFLKGRLTFVGAPAPCPFPTALAYWGPRPWDFHRVFSPRGMVVVLGGAAALDTWTGER